MGTRFGIYRALAVLSIAAVSITSLQSMASESKIALSQLLRDIDNLQPQLTAQLDSSAEGYYTTRGGDTLDRIIDRLMPSVPLRRSILRSAIVAANPHAFKRNNPHWMYANKQIELPDSEAIKAVIFKQTKSQNTPVTMADNRKQWVRYP